MAPQSLCFFGGVSVGAGLPDGPTVSVQEVPRLHASAGVAELAEDLGLDLTDALARDVELLADLLEGAGAAVLQTEAQLRSGYRSGLPHAEQMRFAFPSRRETQYGQNISSSCEAAGADVRL